MVKNHFELPPDYFYRQDERDDALFYEVPRLVVHIDKPAIRALSAKFEALLPPNGRYLDLMSSWRSHLPPHLLPKQVTGLGMNAVEMEQNPQLDTAIVHDLNRQPQLPFPDETFDAVVCTVSIQYLIHPMRVFAEVHRVLRPDGVFVVSFSNRCFPMKAVAVWLATTDEQHIQLVGHYFRASGAWTEPQVSSYTPDESDPLHVIWARKEAA